MDENHVGNSVTQQILNEVFARLEKLEDVDGKIVRGLKELAAKGSLNKHKEIEKAIRPQAGGADETLGA